jgi:hypothetical protein
MREEAHIFASDEHATIFPDVLLLEQKMPRLQSSSLAEMVGLLAGYIWQGYLIVYMVIVVITSALPLGNLYILVCMPHADDFCCCIDMSTSIMSYDCYMPCLRQNCVHPVNQTGRAWMSD